MWRYKARPRKGFRCACPMAVDVGGQCLAEGRRHMMTPPNRPFADGTAKRGLVARHELAFSAEGLSGRLRHCGLMSRRSGAPGGQESNVWGGGRGRCVPLQRNTPKISKKLLTKPKQFTIFPRVIFAGLRPAANGSAPPAGCRPRGVQRVHFM